LVHIKKYPYNIALTFKNYPLSLSYFVNFAFVEVTLMHLYCYEILRKYPQLEEKEDNGNQFFSTQPLTLI